MQLALGEDTGDLVQMMDGQPFWVRPVPMYRLSLACFSTAFNL